MNECPNCGEIIDLSTDDRGTRRSYTGAAVVMVEGGSEINMIAHCRTCDHRVEIWTEIAVVR